VDAANPQMRLPLNGPERMIIIMTMITMITIITVMRTILPIPMITA
jgi:hypothetical protein